MVWWMVLITSLLQVLDSLESTILPPEIGTYNQTFMLNTLYGHFIHSFSHIRTLFVRAEIHLSSMFFNPTLVPSGDNIPPIDSSVFSNIPDIVLCLMTAFINEIRKSIVEIHVLYYAFKVDIAYVSPHKNHIFL